MCVCDTNTCVTFSSSAAGRPSLRPRSNSTALPCQRSSTNRPGSPNGPFTSLGANVEAIAESLTGHGRTAQTDCTPGGARSSTAVLQLLHDRARRLGHHLVHDLSEGPGGVLELQHQL